MRWRGVLTGLGLTVMAIAMCKAITEISLPRIP